MVVLKTLIYLMVIMKVVVMSMVAMCNFPGGLLCTTGELCCLQLSRGCCSQLSRGCCVQLSMGVLFATFQGGGVHNFPGVYKTKGSLTGGAGKITITHHNFLIPDLSWVLGRKHNINDGASRFKFHRRIANA